MSIRPIDITDSLIEAEAFGLAISNAVAGLAAVEASTDFRGLTALVEFHLSQLRLIREQIEELRMQGAAGGGT
jgi:hypothetical protein